jgi:hypothetical protein
MPHRASRRRADKAARVGGSRRPSGQPLALTVEVEKTLPLHQMRIIPAHLGWHRKNRSKRPAANRQIRRHAKLRNRLLGVIATSGLRHQRGPAVAGNGRIAPESSVGPMNVVLSGELEGVPIGRSVLRAPALPIPCGSNTGDAAQAAPLVFGGSNG